MKTKKLEQVIRATVEEMLAQIGIEATLEINQEGDIYQVCVQTQDPGVLIGYHGEILNSFQHLLKLIVYQKTDQWSPLVVDTADYRQGREKVLRSLATSAAERVRLSGQSLALPPLPAYERRVVHLILKEEDGVVSESEGEGRERRVVVKPKSES